MPDLLLILKLILLTEASAAHEVGGAGERTRYQITPIALREVNEQYFGELTENYYTFADMEDENTAKFIAHSYLLILWDKYKCDTTEKLVRGYNGGPKGFLKLSTRDFWKRFQRHAKNEGVKLK